MNREQIFTLIRAHLADELEVDPARITESNSPAGTRARPGAAWSWWPESWPWSYWRWQCA